MGLYKERKLRMADATAVVTADVSRIDLGDISTADTFKVQPTRVDTATAGTKTAAIDYHATGANQAALIETAIQALGGIYASATVAYVSAALHDITVPGGYDVTWAVTDATTFTPGSTTETTPGSVAYTGYIPIGRFGVVKRLRLDDFNDNDLDVVITDRGGGTGYLTVFSKTGIDTSTASADTPYDKYITADGVAGEDGAAAANVSSGLFEGPLKVVATTSAPSSVGQVILFVKMGRSSGLKMRSTGAFSTSTQDVNLGADIVNVKRLYLKSSADTSVAVAIADAYGKNIYTKSSTDFTTAVNAQVSHEGIDQAANAVADTLDVIVKSPATVTLTGLGSGTFTVEFYVET